MDFTTHVLEVVRKIPKGKVMSYGQVAAACGNPRAARAVGWTLRRLSLAEETNIPWWRVINNQGVISIRGHWLPAHEIQRDLLRRDGVSVSEDFTVDLKKYRL